MKLHKIESYDVGINSDKRMPVSVIKLENGKAIRDNLLDENGNTIFSMLH